MGFTTTWYASDAGETYKIRLSDEKVAAAGAAPEAGDAKAPFVKISKTAREFGLRPRMGVYGRDLEAEGVTFVQYTRIPFLTPARAESPPQSVTVGGQAYTFRSFLPEDI